MKRAWLLLLAVALAACENSAHLGAELHRPASLAVFSGYTHSHVGVQTAYLAVANSSSDDLRIIDLSNDTVVPSPGMVFPISVSTDPFPYRVAAASLGDGQPDLLVVVSAGDLSLQLVSTWDKVNGAVAVARSVDLAAPLGAAATGARILSVIGFPVSPGKARVLVGVSGAAAAGKLVVVDFSRASDGSIAPDTAAPQVKALGFDPVDLALAQDAGATSTGGLDTSTVYCATPDLITDSHQHAGFQAFGVAAISTQDWSIQALKAGPANSAGAPTRLVAAATVAERYADNPDHFGVPSRRVYAVLDEGEVTSSDGRSWGCGLGHDLSCGVATLDPAADPTTGRATSLPVDLAQGFQSARVPAQAYRPPVVLPARPMAVGIMMPPATGGNRCVPGPGGDDPNCQTTGETADAATPPTALLLLDPASGRHWTPAAMIVAASDGNPYLIDLGRLAPANDVSPINSDTTRTRTLSAFSLLKDGTRPSAGAPGLGVHGGVSGEGPVTISDMEPSLLVTPGYTPVDTWTITFHGALPGLEGPGAAVVHDGTGVWVALQGLGQIADPALGVRAGDYVDIVLPNPLPSSIPPGTCSASANPDGNGQGRAVVTQIIGPDADRPGGALKLAPLDPADPEFSYGFASSCVLPVTAAVWPVTITVRASGLVLRGASTGYAGRPALDADVSNPYVFGWQEEGPLVARCPDSPAAAHQSAWTADRTACETLSIIRKARRFFYPDLLCAAGSVCKASGWYPSFINDNPLTTGPALQFRVGTYPSGIASPESYIGFSTASGLLPMARGPSAPSIPSVALAFDRTALPLAVHPSAATDRGVFYVGYVSDELVIIPPGGSAAEITTLR